MPEAKYGGWFQGDNGIKKTFVGGVEVSTIRSPSRHVNFETIIFDGPKTEHGTSPQYLYDTEEEALKHHDDLVAELQAAAESNTNEPGYRHLSDDPSAMTGGTRLVPPHPSTDNPRRDNDGPSR